MAASFTRGRLSRMLPLLSMTNPMLTGMSSRLKTESFCSALSSKTRKFSSLRPSAKRPRSSRTVVWRTTRLTSTLMLEPWPPVGAWFGGGGGAVGIWAYEVRGISATPQISSKKAAERTILRRDNLMTGRVVARLGIDRERREASGCAQFDFDFAPARVVSSVAWVISNDILVSQLHADF